MEAITRPRAGYWTDKFRCLVCGFCASRSSLGTAKRCGADDFPECPNCRARWIAMTHEIKNGVQVRRHSLMFFSVHSGCGAQHASGTPCPETPVGP